MIGNGRDQRGIRLAAPAVREGASLPVNGRGAMDARAADGNTQVIYPYGRQTWTDGVIAPALAADDGAIDCPYRGLNTFEERDAAFFFGRGAAATQVLARMSRQVDGAGLLVVSGVSGAGKSSLLRAGVLPQLRTTGLVSARGAKSWPCLLFTPARAPLEELAMRVAGLAGVNAAAVRDLDADPAGFALTARQAAVAQPGAPEGAPAGRAERASRLLLVVDQFEQLFTQCPDEEQRRAFITALHAAATVRHGPDHGPAALVVLVVRADFEARCADYPQLAAAVQDRYLVAAMTERQLRLAITEPASKAGPGVDGGLTDTLLHEVRARHAGASGAGALPLLSYALDQAWRGRTGDTLTLADYERTGGVDGAVADSAQRAYDGLTPSQQAAARQVFTRLTDTAGRALRTELTEGKDAAGAGDVEAVLEAFAAKRLLILAAGTVEISHEILLTAWPLLRDVWLPEAHADRLARIRLDDAADEWNRSSRDPACLYTGSRLAAATETAARISADPARHPPLSQAERDFLDASHHVRNRRVPRRNGIIAFLMVLVIALALVAAVAIGQRGDAVRQRDAAASGQLIDESEFQGDLNPTLAKLLSIAAWRLHPSSRARYAMLAAAASPGIAAFTGQAGRVHALAFSPDGGTLASGGADGAVRLWNVAAHHQMGRALRGQGGQVYSVAFSPRGEVIATGSRDGKVRLWDAATHHLTATLDGRAGAANAVAFSPDGKTLASGGQGIVQLWSMATHRLIGEFPTGTAGPVYSVAFSPDGKMLAAGGAGGVVQLWNMTTRQFIGPIPAGRETVYSVAFSPDGKTLATGGADGTVRLWNVATLQPAGSWPSHGAVFNVAFSPDGQTLASGSLDDTVQLWDVPTGQAIGRPFPGYSLAFSPDGKTLATSGYDHVIRLWDVDSRTGMAALTGHTRLVTSVAFSPDGNTLATGGQGGTVRLWDVATHRQSGILLTGAGAVNSVAFSRNGTTLATGGADGTVRLWDVVTHRQTGTLPNGHQGAVNSVAFNRNGTMLATGSADGTIQLWNVATHRERGAPLNAHAGAVYAVAFSPDGKILASGSADGTVRLWDVASHRQLGKPLTGHTGAVFSVAFSPDGQTLASGSADGTVRLWDVATRQQIGDPLGAGAGQVRSVAFSPDGKTLASGDAGTVRLWDMGYLVDPVSHLCASARSSLTRAEWRHYVPPGPAYLAVCR